MNEFSPPPLEPSSPRLPGSAEKPLGTEPDDTVPIDGISGLVEAVLRHPRRVIHHLGSGAAGRFIIPLVLVATLFVGVYGVILGSFSGGPQWWLVPAKVAGGMLATALICLPSLYIFAGIGGSPAPLRAVAAVVGGLLLLTTLLLMGFAPVAWLFSQSTESIVLMGCLHVVFWLVAVRFGVRFLLSAFRHFGLRTQAGLNVWVAIFVLVSLQMTTALRPLLGPGETLLPTKKVFFAAHWLACIGGEEARAGARLK